MKLRKKIVTFMVAVEVIASFGSTVEAHEMDGAISETEYLCEQMQAVSTEVMDIQLNDSLNNLEKEIMITEGMQTYACQLNNDGYEAYVVNAYNYEEIEQRLNSNLSLMGIEPEGTYLIVYGNDEDNRQISPMASEFSYTYNGKSYRLRYCYVTAADNGSYSQASTCDLLKSTSKTVITNCLNTAINAYISAVCAPLGTVASICGLDISKIAPNKEVTLNMNCGSNWTRIFTEVYNTYDQQWQAGSSVEYVKYKSYMSGYYYNAATNAMEQVPGNESTGVKYSKYYNDYTWRNQKAAIAATNGSGCTYDVTGAVTYYYGNSLKATHSENF